MIATSAIIPASGQGKRLTKNLDKAFVSISGKPLLAHTLAVFQESQDICEIVLVVRDEMLAMAHTLVTDFCFTKVTSIVPGGCERQDSVRNGLRNVSQNTDIVAIHDAARPFVTPDTIRHTIDAAVTDHAAIAAVPVIDTIARSSDGIYVDETLDRRLLYAVQTPQTFRKDVITEAYDKAFKDSYSGTDDASLVERLGIKVRIVPSTYENFKITTPGDIARAERIVADMHDDNITSRRMSIPSWHVGHGYDIHRFAEGRRLILGGVEFPGEEGLLGHSDADVLLHAVADSILGAAGLGDIGIHFPDTDPQFKDANSMTLLGHVGQLAARAGWTVGNIDVTLIAERPKVAKHTSQMAENIASALGLSTQQVNIKATTAEGLGHIGACQGIECHAVAMLSTTL